ncbi:hypothetical protein [Streptomyces cacaoi]|uniref:hypothetical protein n=1 Tax=Streptomyces cacaoi TaxID=1898 RepID=UPI003749C97F
MTSYDLEVALHEDALNSVVSSLYGRASLKEKLFQGSRTASGKTATWSVEECPVVSLRAPDSGFWTHAIARKPPVPEPYTNPFTVTFPKLRLTFDGAPWEREVTALCTLTVYSGNLTVVPVAVAIDLTGADAWATYFYEHVVGPKMLDLSSTLLRGVTVPHITFAEVDFGPPAIAVGEGALVAGTNLADGAAPPAPEPADAAAKFSGGTHFYVLIGPETVRRVAQAQMDAQTGKRNQTSGEAGFGIGKATYEADITLTSATAAVDGAAPDTVGISAGFTAHADAELELYSIGHDLEQVGDAIGHFFKSY